jgi:hypothetical protein
MPINPPAMTERTSRNNIWTGSIILKIYNFFLSIFNGQSLGAYVIEIMEATNMRVKKRTKVKPHVLELGRT